MQLKGTGKANTRLTPFYKEGQNPRVKHFNEQKFRGQKVTLNQLIIAMCDPFHSNKSGLSR